MKQEQMSTLTDGIFAIVMTILVFEIRIPQNIFIVTNQTLSLAVFSIYPLFLSYLLSFSLLFTYWRAHQYIAYDLAKNVDIRLSNLNALFLFFVGLVPFFSHLLGQYSYIQFAIIAFGCNIILISISLWIMRRYIIHSSSIENAPFTKTENEHANVRILFPAVAAIFAILVSFLHKELALVVFTLAILFNLSRRSTRYIFYFVDMFRKRK